MTNAYNNIYEYNNDSNITLRQTPIYIYII